MAIANAYFSSTATIRRRREFTDFDFSPQLSPFKFSSSISVAFLHAGAGISRKKNIVLASIDGVDSAAASLKSEQDADYVPMPIVLIDQDSDSEATIVQISFGDRLGALIDTMKALKDLGLDVAKGTVTTEGSVTQTKFFITRLSTGHKVEDPDLLERIRLTIIINLLKYHPESSEQLAMGEAFGVKAPEKKLDVDIATHIHVKDDGPKRRNCRLTWFTFGSCQNNGRYKRQCGISRN